MKLLTKKLRAQLEKNFTENQDNPCDPADFKPVVKFFNPIGKATWLVTELDPKTDLMFGLCDLGVGAGFPELGYVSLTELQDIELAFGLGIERDMYFTANKSLTEYATSARAGGRINA